MPCCSVVSHHWAHVLDGTNESASLGVANGTPKILGLINFSCDLEISAAFGKSLGVSHAWSQSQVFNQGSWHLSESQI